MELSPKTLVVDARLIKASGIGTDIQNLIPYLKNSYQITLLGDPAELSKYAWAANLEIIKFRKPIYSVAEQLLLPLLVPSCDFFLSPHFNVPVLPVKAKQRIVIIHDVFHLAATHISRIHKMYAKFLLQSALNFSDKIITISEFSRSEIIKYLHVGSKELHKISLGVDHQLYRQSHHAWLVEEVKAKYNLPPAYILFVGNVKPHKNLQNLVIALSKLCSATFADLKLVIVGKKEGFITGDTTLKKLIEDLHLTQRVIFTGFVENEHLPVIYAYAKVFVFPSLYEGFGLPPLEAMAAGCPTIVSDAASMPEVCQDACYYIHANDPNQIVHAISEVLTNFPLRQTLISKGEALAKEYNWEKAAGELHRIIQLQ